MHGKVLRGGPGDLSMRLPCITRLTGYIPLVCIYTAHLYLSVIHRPCHLAGSVVLECFSFDQYYTFNILDMIEFYNPNLSD
jgi:hypothetical protein